jgi:hypothetical protein
MPPASSPAYESIANLSPSPAAERQRLCVHGRPDQRRPLAALHHLAAQPDGLLAGLAADHVVLGRDHHADDGRLASAGCQVKDGGLCSLVLGPRGRHCLGRAPLPPTAGSLGLVLALQLGLVQRGRAHGRPPATTRRDARLVGRAAAPATLTRRARPPRQDPGRRPDA